MSLNIRAASVGLVTCLALALPALGLAAEVGSVKLDDSIKLANQEIKLNGAGIRYKAIFKVYVAALYLDAKKSTPAEVLAASGPKRMTLVMLRDVGNEEFGQSFMTGIQKNSEKAERAKLVNHLLKFGEMFASIPLLKKGDLITIDWIPHSGTHIQLNNKKIIDIIPDAAFYNVLLKIWLGERPADAKLKKQLLGEADEPARASY